jgi:hypothetical protein
MELAAWDQLPCYQVPAVYANRDAWIRYLGVLGNKLAPITYQIVAQEMYTSQPDKPSMADLLAFLERMPNYSEFLGIKRNPERALRLLHVYATSQEAFSTVLDMLFSSGSPREALSTVRTEEARDELLERLILVLLTCLAYHYQLLYEAEAELQFQWNIHLQVGYAGNNCWSAAVSDAARSSGRSPAQHRQS